MLGHCGLDLRRQHAGRRVQVDLTLPGGGQLDLRPSDVKNRRSSSSSCIMRQPRS